MSNNYWAVKTLREVKTALDKERYVVAAYHIEDAIAAILARDDQDDDEAAETTGTSESTKN